MRGYLADTADPVRRDEDAAPMQRMLRAELEACPALARAPPPVGVVR
jgi:hypothetical protein